ncbi:MAG: ATP synthase F1 subunit gamma [Erysipelotrichaceae bacterium]
MSGQISNIKRQLSSITSTKKLTNAMELVATAKLQKQRRKMESNNNYAYNYHKVLMSAVSSCEIDLSSNRYFIKPKQDKPLYIIVTSNSGLCGSYNMDLLKYVTKTVNKEDKVVAVGNYGIKWLNNNKFNVIREYDRMDDLNPHDINYLITDILKAYDREDITSIKIIYTQYINTLTFKPTTMNLLPIEIDTEGYDSQIQLEPDGQTVIRRLVLLYISSQVFDVILQAQASEQASRRAAMDSANRNADGLIDQLRLKYNQARQAAITQEMNEISAATVTENERS